MILSSGHPSFTDIKACGHQLAAVSSGAASDCFVYQQFSKEAPASLHASPDLLRRDLIEEQLGHAKDRHYYRSDVSEMVNTFSLYQ